MSNIYIYLFRAQKYLVIFGVIYLFLVGLLAVVPYLQSQYVLLECSPVTCELNVLNPLILV